MKIAIYGDSWGSIFLDSSRKDYGWPTIIANNTNHLVDNYSVVGSSLFFSYKEFLNNFKKYDINIFLITSPGRMFINSIPDDAGSTKHIPNIQTLNHLKVDLKNKSKHKTILSNIYDALEKYFVYLQSNEFDEAVHKSIIFYLKSITNNTIFINCFKEDNNFCLLDIAEYENNMLGAFDTYFSKNLHIGTIKNNMILSDLRVCHLSKTNNKILADKIINAINTNDLDIMSKLSLDDFAVPAESLDECISWVKI